MSGSYTLTNRQKVTGGVTILDEDRQPFTTLPEGVTLSFTSSNPEILGVQIHPDGMNVTLISGMNGSATLTVHADGITAPAGDPFPDDVTNFSVVNSRPNALNFTLGSAEPEDAGEPGADGASRRTRHAKK